MKYLLPICIFMTGMSLAQKDTVQEIVEVTVRMSALDSLRIPVRNTFYLDRKDIMELAPNDMGELLQKFAGISMKSYGGLGGMKTFSYRSLGSQHAALVVDGFTQQNVQTGQVNLGNLSTENVNSLMNTSELNYHLMPVSAQLSGVSFSAQTFDNSFPVKRVEVRTVAGFGSFDHLNFRGSAKVGSDNWYVNANGGYRYSSGEYPFSYFNGDERIFVVRNNNRYSEFAFGNGMGYRSKKVEFRIACNYREIDQELPGAVVLYNSTADEELSTRLLNLFSDVRTRIGKVDLRVYLAWNRNALTYLDPSYLNAEGFLEAHYNTDHLNGGFNLVRKAGNFTFFGGSEENYARLTTNDGFTGIPERFSNQHMLGAYWRKKQWSLKGMLGGQHVLEYSTGTRSREMYYVNPSLQIGRESARKWRAAHQLSYRNSLRLPSFNELYYNNIGNKNLEPEKADQFSYELSVKPLSERLKIAVMTHLFVNRIKDLIVAIPTKNLFVWSIQNVGVTNAFGADAVLKLKWNIKKLEFRSDVNYTFQRTIDVTDRESPTYLHQVAYIPLHTGNADLSCDFRNFGLRFSNLLIGSRYSLNENVAANLLPGFWVADATAYYRYDFRAGSLTLQLNCKNLFDVSYAFVRWYVMPGRSFMLTLRYDNVK